MDTLKKYNYEKEFDIETKGYSKKAKKSFRKCVEYETKKNPIRDRLKKKLESREKEGW